MNWFREMPEFIATHYTMISAWCLLGAALCFSIGISIFSWRRDEV